MRKFFSTIAEFKSALYFANREYQITFLLDSQNIVNKQTKQYPDFLAEKKTQKYLSEVYHLEGGSAEYKVLEKLRPLLKLTPYVVRFDISEELSHPCLNRLMHLKHDAIIDADIQSFMSQLTHITPMYLPKSIDTTHIAFEVITVAKSGQGYIGSCSSGCEIPIPYFEDRINFWVEKKAGKRADFSIKHPDTPYIVSIISEEKWLDHEDIEPILNQLFISNSKTSDVSGVLFRDFRTVFKYYSNYHSKPEILLKEI